MAIPTTPREAGRPGRRIGGSRSRPPSEAMIWPTKRLIWVMPPAAAAGAASQSRRLTPGSVATPEARSEAYAARRHHHPEKLRNAGDGIDHERSRPTDSVSSASAALA